MKLHGSHSKLKKEMCRFHIFILLRFNSMYKFDCFQDYRELVHLLFF